MAKKRLDEQQNKDFYKIADSFIDIANEHCDNQESTWVGSALLFATARFSAFVVASQSTDQANYEAEIDNAMAFFTTEFKRMLTENLEDYKTAFKLREDAPKYDHLMKK